MVNLLLNQGAVIDCRTRDLLTPLHCAARSGNDAVVDLLLEKSAPISAKTKVGFICHSMDAENSIEMSQKTYLLKHRIRFSIYLT